MHTSVFQKFCSHLFIHGFFHALQIAVIFPERKVTIMVAAIEVGFAFIYQASTYRTCSNAFSGLKSSCFFFGNRIASIQHHGQHVFDPGHKLFRCNLSMLHQEQLVFPFCSHTCRFQEVRQDLHKDFSIICWKDLFSFSGGILGIDQFFDDTGSCCRSS